MPAPTYIAISPARVPATVGNRAVQVVGRNFDAATTVTVATVAPTTTEIVSQFLLQFVPANHAAGAADVVITNGSGSVTATAALTYV